MRHKLCPECYGIAGHHSNGCPETPEEPEVEIVTENEDGYVTTLTPDHRGRWDYAVMLDGNVIARGYGRPFDNAERAAKDAIFSHAAFLALPKDAQDVLRIDAIELKPIAATADKPSLNSWPT